MRLFLLPISTRRTLLYCARVPDALSGSKSSWSEWAVNYVSSTWAGWERQQSGWQKQVTSYGNQLFKRIPYEEWGLKSIPPATKARLEQIDKEKHEFECLYPGAFMRGKDVLSMLRKLATERQAFHKGAMWRCVLWMPVVSPLTLVPVIPNFPLFYLAFRAWSHYRALYGGRLLEHMLNRSLVTTSDSKILNEMYAAGLLHPGRPQAREAPAPKVEEIERVAKVVEGQSTGGQEEVMLLQQWNGKLIAEGFESPEMQIEIERAVEQVETALKKDQEKRKGEKKEVEQAVDLEKQEKKE